MEDIGRVYCAFTRTPGDCLHLPQLSGSAHLVLWCTPWSGQVEIVAESEVMLIDAYSESHRLIEVPLPGDGQRDICIRLDSSRHALAADNELWILGLVVESHQDWLGRVVRLPGSLDLTHGDFGTFLTVRDDSAMSQAIRTRGAWNAEHYTLISRLVRQGNLALDVGANIGHQSVMLSRLVGPHGKVFAFEQAPSLHRVLAANLELNACHNVHTYGYELRERDGEAAPQQMPSKRLDAVMASAGEVNFINCSTPGYALGALLGAEWVLATSRPPVLVQVAPLAMPGGPTTYLDLYDYLRRFGYLLLDPLVPDPGVEVRRWSGAEEEWTVLAVQEMHLSLVRPSVD